MKDRPRVLASYIHTPGVASQRLFHTVLRAGHLLASPLYRVERHSYPGHDLLFCVDGAGSVRCGEKVFAVAAGQLAWIDCAQPHAHWADPRAPWELLWLRIDGQPSRLFADALNVREGPVFTCPGDGKLFFLPIFALLRQRPLAIDAALHEAVTSLTAGLFASRQPAAGEGKPLEEGVDSKLRPVLARLRRQPNRVWKVEELARLSGLSVPHFFRRFRQVVGSSPIDWIRRERVNQAKRQLIENDVPIRDIALALGYRDPFYFSRDFKKLTGLSPRQYRRQERFSIRS